MIEIFSLTVGLVISILLSIEFDFFDSVLAIALMPVLWIFFTVLTAAALLFFMYLFSICLNKTQPKKPSKFCYFLIKLVIGTITRATRIRIHIKNGHLIEPDRQYVLVSNHRSQYDPIIQFYVFKRCRPVMISKPENMNIPIAGRVLNKAGFLAIDRDNNREALKTIIKASSFIENYKLSIGVCPEGTRNREGRDLLPLKAGALKIATKAKAPIAVMTFEGTEKIHKNSPFKKTDVYIDVLKIITAEQYADKTTQELCDEIAVIMQNNIDLYTLRKEQCKKTSA